MNVKPNEDFKEVLTDYQNYPSEFQSIILATTTSQGSPNASCVPFAMDENKNFYVLVSDLTVHANNLKETKKGSILFIEDENGAKNIFARKRLNYECSSILIERTNQEWKTIIALLEKRFGEKVKFISTFQDFNVFKLIPQEGRFVTGFGKIYDIKAGNLNDLILFRKKS